MEKFQGFTPATNRFFRDLGKNNTREWFTGHQGEYHKHVRDPMRQLAAELLPILRELDPMLVSDPKRHISRIYRDVRFSNDKTPYWTCQWMAFRRNLKEWYRMPTYLFEVDETGYLCGMNVYAPTASTMRRFREMIDEQPEIFREITTPISRSRSFALESEKYRKPFKHDHPKSVDPWYQSKTIGVFCRKKPDETLFSRKLIDMLIARFIMLKPLYDFLWKAALTDI